MHPPIVREAPSLSMVAGLPSEWEMRYRFYLRVDRVVIQSCVFSEIGSGRPPSAHTKKMRGRSEVARYLK